MFSYLNYYPLCFAFIDNLYAFRYASLVHNSVNGKTVTYIFRNSDLRRTIKSRRFSGSSTHSWRRHTKITHRTIVKATFCNKKNKNYITQEKNLIYKKNGFSIISFEIKVLSKEPNCTSFLVLINL